MRLHLMLIALLTTTVLVMFSIENFMWKIFALKFIIKLLFLDENIIEMHNLALYTLDAIWVFLWILKSFEINCMFWRHLYLLEKNLKCFIDWTIFQLLEKKSDCFIHLYDIEHNIYWTAKCVHCLDIIVTKQSILYIEYSVNYLKKMYQNSTKSRKYNSFFFLQDEREVTAFANWKKKCQKSYSDNLFVVTVP